MTPTGEFMHQTKLCFFHPTDTIFMTVSVKAKETLVITNGFYTQEVFYIINSIQWEVEDMVWARSTLSLPCTISMV